MFGGRLGRGGAGRDAVHVRRRDELPVRDPAATRATLPSSTARSSRARRAARRPARAVPRAPRPRPGAPVPLSVIDMLPAVSHSSSAGSVGGAHANAREGDVELLGPDPRDGRGHALAELDPCARATPPTRWTSG